MKKILSRVIHFFIMPCSQATWMMERQRIEGLPLWRSVQLKAHLRMCKWCAAYYKKLNLLDKMLVKEEENEKKEGFQSNEIQSFKETMKRKIEK